MVDDTAWEVELARMKETKAVRDEERAAARATAAYREQEEVYSAYERRVQAFGMATLFHAFRDKSPSSGWQASASVVTDGVSLCVTYEKTVLLPLVAAGSKRKRPSKAADSEPPPEDDYDPAAATTTDELLVLGLDPGRTCLATIVCIDQNGKRHVWRMTRGTYYSEGGIFAENRRQRARYSELAPRFADIAEAGGSLRASSSEQLVKYLERYAQFQAEWWALALRRCEARAKMHRHISKQKVLARFFSRVRREATALLTQGQKLEVAYGASGPSMAASGQGEVAVPTTSAYKACVLAFRPSDQVAGVALQNEEYTSKMCWETGGEYHKVYKKYRDSDGAELLCSTDQRYMPLMREQDMARWARVQARAKATALRRRGGDSCTNVAKHQRLSGAGGCAGKKREARYPECRGLRFCPKRRMFYDRDEASARAIAGLRCLKLRGLGRPSAFRRKSTNSSDRSSSMECGMPMVSLEGKAEEPYTVIIPSSSQD